MSRIRLYYTFKQRKVGEKTKGFDMSLFKWELFCG